MKMKKNFGILILLFIVFLMPITTIKAKTIADLQKELDAAEKKLNDTNTKKAINSQNITDTNKKINSIKSSIKDAEDNIVKKEEESKQLEKDIALKNDQIKDLMRYYQISSSGSAMLEYIMGAESITDLIYRLSITEQISSYNKKAIKQMNDMIEENERIKKELTLKKEELTRLKSDLDTQVIVLNQKQSELDKEGESDAQAVKGMQKQIKYYKSIGCRDNESLDACYDRIYGKNYLPSGTTFLRPSTTGRISSEFGNRTLNGAFNKHFAIDIAMPTGTPIYPVAPGIVGYTDSVCGITLVLWHNVNGKTYSSIYCHLSKQLVKKGQVVTTDTKIALSGCTGQCYGAHLHLGLATGKYKSDYYRYYKGKEDSLENHTFNPRNVIVFPAKGQSYYNR